MEPAWSLRDSLRRLTTFGIIGPYSGIFCCDTSRAGGLEMRSSTCRWIACVALAALAGPHPTRAQPAPEWRFCDARAVATPDVRIQACTALIGSARVSERNRTAAYNNRGAAWLAKGEIDRAIADFTEEIRLDPTDANGYRVRRA